MTTLPLDAAPAGLASAMRDRGFEQLTAVQSAVLSPDAHDRDLRISSQTGSGKTVAIGLLLAERFAQRAERRPGPARPRALLIAPTRELAVQLGQELEWLYAPLGARVVCVTGGVPVQVERRALAGAPDVLVGTPGRLLDHLRRGGVSLEGLEALVLDEADELLAMGFEEDLFAIVGFTPAERRTHLVSATFSRRVLQLADRLQTNPVRVEGTPLGEANEDIDHVVVLLGGTGRLAAIVNTLLRHPDEKSLLFVRTRADATELTALLSQQGFVVRALHGDMTPRERTATFHEFRAGALKLLVATDVAARGLDVTDIGRVIQVDLPESPAVLTHRSGRTGRAGRQGENIVLVSDFDRFRAKSLFRAAGINPRVGDVPTPQEVRAAADKRLIETLAEATPVEDEGRKRLAEALLEGRDAAEVVALLLERSGLTGPCEPHEVLKARPPRPQKSGPPAHQQRPGGYRKPAHGGGRGYGPPRRGHAASS